MNTAEEYLSSRPMSPFIPQVTSAQQREIAAMLAECLSLTRPVLSD